MAPPPNVPRRSRDGRRDARRLRLPRRTLLALLAAPAACAAGIATPLAIEAPPPGPMRLLGGLVLNADAIGFGGLSGLHLAPDLTLTAVSDAGAWLVARLVLDAFRPVGLELLRTGALREMNGEPMNRGKMGDAEGLARLPDGSWLVSFERWHRIRAYRELDQPGIAVQAPPGLERAGGNQGLEALAVLEGGTWLAISEGLAVPDNPHVVRAWLGGPGRWRPVAYRPEPGFRPVDAAALPSGGALVLERYFSILGGFEGRVVRLSPAALGAEVLAGEELLRLAAPLPVDNYEGLAVTRHAGRTLVAVLSDDNQSVFQRSLLLLFELVSRGN